jgi:hypothetical protein
VKTCQRPRFHKLNLKIERNPLSLTHRRDLWYDALNSELLRFSPTN